MIRFLEGNIAQILSQNNANINAENSDYLDKNCILLTEGKFNSMDGKITISTEHLQKIVKVYNDKIDAIRRDGREPSMADYHPAQLDHSTSARDTVGRLIGPLAIQEHNGKQTLFGVIRFLGSEAVEKVSDGRWTHLSVGINSLKTCELDEITITPFPACKDAILFSNRGANMTEEEKKKEADEKKLAEEKKKEADEKKLAEEKKKEAEKKALAAKEDEEKEAEKKALAAKEDEEKEAEIKAKKKLEDDEKEENKTKLSSVLTSIRAKQDGIRLAIKQGNIKSRLTKLRSEAKITPAELKKIDMLRLAKANDETINAVMESYDNRQPVLHTAIYGSVSAINPATVANNVRLSQLEMETRKRFSSIPKKEGDESNHDTDLSVNKFEAPKNENDDNDLWPEIVKSIKTGDEELAKEMYRKMCGKKLEAESGESTETEMKQLMSDFASLESDFSEVVRLASVTSGIKI